MKERVSDETVPKHVSAGARALVILHERRLRSFVEVWRQAKAADLKLPVTDDSDYESLETLLVHVVRAARGYMVWMCESLELPARSLFTFDPVVQGRLEPYLGLEVFAKLGRYTRASVKEQPGELYVITEKQALETDSPVERFGKMRLYHFQGPNQRGVVNKLFAATARNGEQYR